MVNFVPWPVQSPSFPLFFCSRRLIKEMEEKQKCEKAELERMQQEVASQRKESEQVQLRIRRQEESLRRRSQDIESRLRDLIAEKERFQVRLLFRLLTVIIFYCHNDELLLLFRLIRS